MENINVNKIAIIENNSTEKKIKKISDKYTVKKFDIDILGVKGGEVKCGGRLLSTLPKE